MQLQPVMYAGGLREEQFASDFLKPKVPVIITDFISGSEALRKWNYDYFISRAGDRQVSVHGSEVAHTDKVSSIPDKKMSFAEYLAIIKREPTEMRLFLFNLLLERPDMRKDIRINLPVRRFLKKYPFMFFGGAGSSVRYHYDIDMSHVFLTQFEGEKQVLLFSNDQSDLLYRLPHNFHGVADLKNPDYDKFPALRFVKGWECTLRPGETLFIPSGCWHYITYISQGYSVAHRALSSSFIDQLTGFRNIVITRRFDNLMRKLFREKWFNHKMEVAYKRAGKALAKKNAGPGTGAFADSMDTRRERILDI